MLKNNIFLAIRQLKKNKLFSLINVLGLSLSMVACLLIFKYVSFEKSYEDYHEKVDNLHRLIRTAQQPTDGWAVASIFPAISPELKANFPEIVESTRIIGVDKIFQSFAFSNYLPNGSANTFNISSGFFADHDALSIFKFNWLDGAGGASLKNPDEIVISESMAKKFFGTELAVGKTLHLKNMNADFRVTGVFQDLPVNTHFHFEVLIAFKFLPDEWGLDQDYGWGNFYTYMRFTDGADIEDVTTRVNKLLHGREPWYIDEGIRFEFQKVKDIHLTSNLQHELEANGNERTVNFLSIIGFFIMVVAWVNYINLSTSKLVDRGKEVGIRKVLGSYKRQLIEQFITESLLINFVAIALTLTLLQLTLEFFQGLLGIPLSFISGDSLPATLAFIGAFSLGSVLFGLYPALLFSRLKVTQVLKGKSKVSRSGLLLRKGLTVFQFAIALVLIIGTMAVYQQLSYLQNKSLGMNIDQTLVIRKPFMDSVNRESSKRTFLNGLEALSSVKAASVSSEIPGQLITRQRWMRLEESEESDRIYAKDIAVDENYFDLYEIEMLYGRNFTPEDPQGRVILNESAARNLFGAQADLNEKINQSVFYENRYRQLIGIIADYNQESLKTTKAAHIYSNFDRIRFYSIKVGGTDIKRAVEDIEALFGDSFADSHFDYFFLDSFFDRQYRSDRLFGRIFAFFSILAIVITVLGLFGLSLYNISQRSKEVSIRKVLGASLQNLSVLLSKEYLYLVIIAAVISIPLAYFMVDQWLSGFPYRMDIGMLMFLLPVVLVGALTLFTIGYQVIKAALANPADTLRWE